MKHLRLYYQKNRAMKYKFSVIIPLYNKEAEIEDTILSILAQSYQPFEIIVVDDGSTDSGADIVRAIESPLIRLITQRNQGECAARNRAIEEARGEYMALLDGDDTWQPEFLAEIASMIAEFPNCGVYSTAFNIVSHDGLFLSDSPTQRGVVANFFKDSLTRNIVIPSASVIPKVVVGEVGGFPAGMKMGGDQYMWIKIARKYKICFSPKNLTNYSKIASNRSSSIYTPESSDYSFETLYNPEAEEYDREFIARVALGKALVVSAKGGTREARHTANIFAFTKYSRRIVAKVRLLNILPIFLRMPLFNLYNRLAWRVARKGL